MDRESLRLLLAQGESIERIAKRFGKHPSTVSYWMAKHDLVAVNRAKHAARGALPRERLEALVVAGLTIAEIATEVGRSKATVRHWLRRHGLRTRGTARSNKVREARQAGSLELTLVCPRHGATGFVIEGRGYYRCRRCRSEQIGRHRRRLEQLLVDEAGGCCQSCGYDRSLSALEFHHVDPDDKRLGISAGGLTLSLESLRAEVTKCVLLCSNCHAEVEAGVRVLDVKCGRKAPSPASIHLNPG
jgi:transposase